MCILLYDIPYHTGRRTNGYSVFNINYTFLRDNYQKISIHHKTCSCEKRMTVSDNSALHRSLIMYLVVGAAQQLRLGID